MKKNYSNFCLKNIKKTTQPNKKIKMIFSYCFSYPCTTYFLLFIIVVEKNKAVADG